MRSRSEAPIPGIEMVVQKNTTSLKGGWKGFHFSVPIALFSPVIQASTDASLRAYKFRVILTKYLFGAKNVFV